MKKTAHRGIGTILICQLIDREFYEAGTMKSHRWVWLRKATWLGISYPTYLRNLRRKIQPSQIPEGIYHGIRQAVKSIC